MIAPEQNFTPVFTREQIDARNREIGAEINECYKNQPLVAVCVLKGAFVFFSDLIRKVENPNLEVDFVRLASYGMSDASSGHVVFNKDVDVNIRGKHVLIVEDIVDSGHTMKFLMSQFASRQPASLRLAALIDKRERREAAVDIDFPGFTVSKGFLAGYGLDYAERYRSVPFIFEVNVHASPERLAEKA